MASSSSTAPKIDASIWRAVAGASVRLPPPNSFVYYFPQGHLEQYADAEAAAAQNSTTTLDRPFIPCRVLSVDQFYHPQTGHPMAKILLQPTTNTGGAGGGDCFQNGGGNGDCFQSDVVSYAKVLTPSDANNGGGFSVPRSCADSIFPRLDFAADPPVQTLRVRDTRGNAWEFRHIYRGTPRRHLLTTGWSKFVNAKRLIAGDSVVFMRKKSSAASSSDRHHPRDELFVGVRRAGKSGAAASEATGEMEKAAKGMAFEVVYHARVGSPDFVVGADRVEEASRIQWSRGTRVRMEVVTEDSTRMASSDGTVTAVSLPESWPWRGSPWRMLQVTWDEPGIIFNAERVSPWELEFVSHAPPLIFPELPPAKRFKALMPDHHQGVQIRDVQPAAAADYHNPNQTFTQLLMKCIESDDDEDDDDDDDDEYVGQQGGDNVGGSSFRLFGHTIDTSENGGGGSGKQK